MPSRMRSRPSSRRHPPVFDGDADGGDAESLGGDAAGRPGLAAVPDQSVDRIRLVPEILEGRALQAVQQGLVGQGGHVVRRQERWRPSSDRSAATARPAQRSPVPTGPGRSEPEHGVAGPRSIRFIGLRIFFHVSILRLIPMSPRNRWPWTTGACPAGTRGPPRRNPTGSCCSPDRP